MGFSLKEKTETENINYFLPLLAARSSSGSQEWPGERGVVETVVVNYCPESPKASWGRVRSQFQPQSPLRKEGPRLFNGGGSP